MLVGDKSQPAPGAYELIEGFDRKWAEKDMGTHFFRDKITKKILPINLYNPHEEPEDLSKKQPEMGTYKL